MSAKTLSGYVNLVHKLAAAGVARHGGDCSVDYVPVSRTPFVDVEVGAHPIGRDADPSALFAEAERLRTFVAEGLLDHGFHSIAGEQADRVLGREKAIATFRVFAKEAEGTWRVVTLDDHSVHGLRPSFRIDVTVDVGPGGLRYYQETGTRSDDLRERFVRAVGRRQEELSWARSGMDRIVLALVSGLPFRVSSEGLRELRNMPDEGVVSFASAVATGTVTDEESFLVALGHEPSVAPVP